MEKKTSVFDNLPEEKDGFVKFNEENGFYIQVQFIDDEPCIVASTFTQGKDVYEFEVVDLSTPDKNVKTWSVSSLKLMHQLAAFTPLSGKAFTVQRTGERLKIEYELSRKPLPA